ncbi:MAG: hypothetical protein AAGH78_05765 [Cyanobacteria bacterium P01_H01_bin.58]
MGNRKQTDAQMSSLELKFLLRLLSFPHYRAPLAQIRPNAQTSPAVRDRLCRQLQRRGWIDYEEVVTQFGLTAAGRTLLTLDTSILPITPDERFVLQSCGDSSITPGQIKSRVPKNHRQRLILGLEQRGLIRVVQRPIKDVWLTTEGQRFLRNDCSPQGQTPVLSWSLMSSYLQFLRQQQSDKTASNTAQQSITPNELMQTIAHLDAVLQTDNYLPIYYLREKTQPPLSRQGLDQYLYQLQREDRIDLSTLQDVSQYRKEEVAAGIPQDIGGPLFFISVM